VSDPTSSDLEFLERIIPAAAASVDRLEQVPARLGFLFDYSATRALAEPSVRAEALASRDVINAFAEDLRQSGRLLDREAFRAATARVRERTGQKGKALFHPIRLALTGQAEGLELDIAVPAIEAGAALQATGIRPIPSARERAGAFASALNLEPRT
jgi:glutamyl/glutaminyl-tRNA synthetase